MWVARDGFGWWMIFSSFWIIVFIVALAWVFGSLGSHSRQAPPPHHETPEEIAKRRLASGEITHEEYDRLIEKLRQ